ncbi:MAG: AMP-binding protein, partial [Pseudomonadota bacterium]
MTEKIWLSSYVPGVPEYIDNAGYDSLADLIDDNVKKFASKPAYANMGTEFSFAEIDAMSLSFASWLQGKGLNKGDRIALMMPNLLQYP